MIKIFEKIKFLKKIYIKIKIQEVYFSKLFFKTNLDIFKNST